MFRVCIEWLSTPEPQIFAKTTHMFNMSVRTARESAYGPRLIVLSLLLFLSLSFQKKQGYGQLIKVL